MNLLSKTLIVGSSAFLLSGCNLFGGGETPTLELQEDGLSDIPMDTSGASDLATIMAEDGQVYQLMSQNNSGQTGTALLQEVDGQIRVTLTLTDLGSTPQPAHIHTGACPEPGAVVYPLNNVVNGQSTTTLALDTATLLSQGPLALNVHKSASEASVYTACVDIVN